MVDPDEDPASSTPSESDADDGSPGVLDSLLAEINSWDVPDEERDTAGETERSSDQAGDTRPHADDAETPPLGGDPLDQVRTILDSRDLPEIPPLPDPVDQQEQPGLHLVALAGLLMVVLSTLLVTGALPSMFSDRPSATALSAESGLSVDADDAAYLNRVFRETSNEVAYCGGISTQEGTPQLEIWMADTIHASSGHVEFETSNCPDGFREVLLHTHPEGTIELSPQDKATLQAREETVLCVQAGTITTTPGERTQDLGCYRQQSPQTDTLDLIRIPIMIVD